MKRWLLHARPGLLLVGFIAGVLFTTIASWLFSSSPPPAAPAPTKQEVAKAQKPAATTRKPTPSKRVDPPPPPDKQPAATATPSENTPAAAEAAKTPDGSQTPETTKVAPAHHHRLSRRQRHRLRIYLSHARRAARKHKWKTASAYAKKALALQPDSKRAAAIMKKAQAHTHH